MNKNLKANILVIGDVMLDKYWFGDVKRISPEAPVPIIRVAKNEVRPGGAANVAYNISNFYNNVSLIGLVGDDNNSQTLNTLLKKNKIKCHFVKDQSYKTITKLRIISKRNNQQLMRIDSENLSSSLDKKLLLKYFFKYIKKADVVVLSDYGKGSLFYSKEIITFCRKIKKPVLVDPKGGNFNKYKGATVITPNLSEFEEIVGHCRSEQEMNLKGKELLRKLKLKYLLITLGERGMKLVSKNKIFDLESVAQEVYDVSGAGDTVISVLAWSLIDGKNIEDAAIYANAAAGVVVGKVGTAFTTEDEIVAFISPKEHTSKLIKKVSLKKVIDTHKKEKRKVVITNGCFDLLHSGHISYLSEAKKLGDVLIVAVNSDSSVRKLKGKSRPITNLKNRMEVLSGLEAVDYVISFNEETPNDLYNYLIPNLIVKGGDYKKESVVGYELMKKSGGDVKILNFIEGFSTTKIIDKMSS